MEALPSMNMPTMIRKMSTATMKTHLLLIVATIHCVRRWGSCSLVRIQENVLAAATISRMEQVVSSVSCTALRKSRNDSSRYRMPSSSAYMQATEPASVAVKTPMRMPPMMMTGSSSGRNAGLSAPMSILELIFSLRMEP